MSYLNGFWDTVSNIIGSVGLSNSTATAIARAYASPSLSNIQAVQDAFAAEGTTVPPEIMALLQKRYVDAAAAYPTVYGQNVVQSLSSALPWIAAGVIGYLILKRGK